VGNDAGAAGGMNREIDLAEVLDRQTLGRPLLTIIVLCTLVTLADGYNISAAGFAAPGIVKDWGLSRASLGPLFSSSLLAGLIGPSLFGTLAGRIGRRRAILSATVLFGVFGLLCAACDSLIPLVTCRFLAGVGMSGALAATVANISEFAPRRLRATFVTLIFSGTTFGSGAIGLVAPFLAQHFDWQGIFIFGGAVTLLSAALVFLFLPESPKYLCLREASHRELASLLRRLDPRFVFPAGTRFVQSDEVNPPKVTYRPFFAGPLLLLTPLLWLGSFVGQVVFHSFNNWLPTLLTDSGLPYSHAAAAVVLFQFAGTLGGWVIMRPLDRYGMLPCALLYLLSIPVVACLGLPGNSETMLMVLCSLAGFCVLGLHFAQVFCVSSIYPTAIRALGVGFFMLFARAGGSLGPYLVGVLSGRHVPVGRLFVLGTIPLAIGALAAIAITVIYRAHFHMKSKSTAQLPVNSTHLEPEAPTGS
jgi:AAHS family 4-hydroxybenzoate transporter-like MFS transporter